MLRASWIPSPLMPPGSRPAVPIVDTAKPSRFRSALVIAQFAALGLSLLVLLVTRGDQDRFAHRVRELFERLGGLWIKVGQVIAPQWIDHIIFLRPNEAGVLFGTGSHAGVMLVYTRDGVRKAARAEKP